MLKVEGKNPVYELLQGDRDVKELLLQQGLKGKRIKTILQKASKKNITIKWLDKNSLDNVSETGLHQGIIAITSDIKYFSPRKILKEAENKGEPPFIIILDQIQDPHNFGAIIRTAYAAGVHGIIFPKDRAVEVTPVVEKTSAGAVEHVILSQVSNINYTIKDLKKAGLWIVGTDIAADKVYYKQDLTGAMGIVIGNEGQGLRRLVKENCDFMIKIPMQGKLGSLNASVAAGIIIYEALRQRE